MEPSGEPVAKPAGDDEESESLICTDEAGEPTQWDPVEGRGGRLRNCWRER